MLFCVNRVEKFGLELIQSDDGSDSADAEERHDLERYDERVVIRSNWKYVLETACRNSRVVAAEKLLFECVTVF